METKKKNGVTPIKSWAVDDRPREKMLLKGASALSDSELLAILINNGNQESSALDLAKQILALGKNNLNELGKLNIKDFCQVRGIGPAKAIAITAALEIGRRRESGHFLQKSVIRSSQDVAGYLKTKLKDYIHEVFAVVFLNRANKIIDFQIISSGGISGTVADPRIILKQAVQLGASVIILSHNHPSGNLRPSKADEDITQKIVKAASYLDIKVADHIIVSEEGYFSFADEALL
ncbi:MAG: DNA repair protein RadC [Ferruginibacter sp.]